MIKYRYNNSGRNFMNNINKLSFENKEKRLYGVSDAAARFLAENDLRDMKRWHTFADQFRERRDGENNGWRGEFFGKAMRGAVLVYEYLRTPELYLALTEAVEDILTVADDDGRVSSYTRETEFSGWDIWSRKYVILSLIYFLDICKDESLKERVIRFISRAADYIIERIGDGEGKIGINNASSFWYGLNSSSILEPIVKLYKITGEKRYFDFAAYIVECGGTAFYNIFELAYENKKLPYQYGIAKAYEMISCFEGLLEFYRITGNERYKVMLVNFANALLESEVSVIGSSGSTHELFDKTTVRQTYDFSGPKHETCVTVTLMKFLSEMLSLTGDKAYADCMEISFYNAYLGALNTGCRYSDFIEKKYGDTLKKTVLPFDSYSPVIPGARGVLGVGGFQVFSDNGYYGCCACIGAAGLGVFHRAMLMRDKDGFVLNFYEKGRMSAEYSGARVDLSLDTEYPRDGRILIKVKTDSAVNMALKLRIPEWSRSTEIKSNSSYEIKDGYAVFSGEWSGETEIELALDMTIRVVHPISWDTDAIFSKWGKDGAWTTTMPVTVTHIPEYDKYIALLRGPIVLAMDERITECNKFNLKIENELIDCELTDEREVVKGEPCILRCTVEDEKFGKVTLVDYGSAGKDWKSVIAAWLPIE